MSKVTALSSDDRDFIERLIDNAVQSAKSVETTELTISIASDLETLCKAGDPHSRRQSRRAQNSLIRDGLRARVETRLKADRASIKIRRSGRIVSLPARLGISTIEEEDGTRRRTFQQHLWWELSWPQFDELIATMRARGASINREAEALMEVHALRAMYPDTKTVGEACERAGIDPRVFQILDKAA